MVTSSLISGPLLLPAKFCWAGGRVLLSAGVYNSSYISNTGPQHLLTCRVHTPLCSAQTQVSKNLLYLHFVWMVHTLKPWTRRLRNTIKPRTLQKTKTGRDAGKHSAGENHVNSGVMWFIVKRYVSYTFTEAQMNEISLMLFYNSSYSAEAVVLWAVLMFYIWSNESGKHSSQLNHLSCRYFYRY